MSLLKNTEHRSDANVGETQILAAQVRQLFAQALPGMYGAVIASIALAAVLWNATSQPLMIAWLSIFLVVQVFRHELLSRFRKSDPTDESAVVWGRWFLVGSVITAVLWGAVAIVLFPKVSFPHQVILAAFLAGVSASTMVAHSAVKECYLSSVVLALSPLLGRFIYEGGYLPITMGLLGFVFMLGLLGAGRSINAVIRDTIRLRFENTDLIKDLRIATTGLEDRVNERTRELQAANQQLRDEIAGRAEVEEALRESEDLLRRSQEIARVGSWQLDLASSRLIWSDEVYRIFGLQPEQYKATYEAFLETVHPDDRALVDEEYSSSIREGRDSHEIEHRIVRKSSGEIRHVFEKCQHFKDSTGRIVRSVGIVQDVTERKLAEEALKKSEQLYRSVIENIEDVFYRSDTEGKLSMASPSGARVFGYGSVAEMIGTPLEAWWANPQERQRLLDIVVEHGKVSDFEGVLKRKDGSSFIASLSTHFYRDQDGEILGTEGIVRDITERKQIEAQLIQSQKMEAIGTLAGGVAHEINNLLQIVMGHADMLLLREALDEKSAKSAEAIRRAARNGSELVDRILTFSRKSEPEMRPVNLSDDVRRVDELLRRTLPRIINIEMSLEESLSMIHADPSQIEQILLNLATNARDSMPDGGTLLFRTENATIGEEYCRTHPDAKPGKYVLLTVSDTGGGMEKDIVNRIFEPFFTTKQPGAGTGLGLSMVFGVVKNHRGHITCNSEPGRGTTFKIYFPAVEIKPTVVVTSPPEMPAGGTETILLVDDEEAVRALGAEMLELAGYTVVTAANGREAVEIYSKNMQAISLVILDLVMPEMGGIKCLEEILGMDPEARVLIASGYSADGSTREALEGGASGFIAKPFDLKQILVAARKSLSGQAKPQDLLIDCRSSSRARSRDYGMNKE